MSRQLTLAVAVIGMLIGARGVDAQAVHHNAADVVLGGVAGDPADNYVFSDLSATEGPDGIHFSCAEKPDAGILVSHYDLRGRHGNTTITNANWNDLVSLGTPSPSYPNNRLVAEWVVAYPVFPAGLGDYSFALGANEVVVSNTAHISIAGDHVAPAVPGHCAVNPALTTMTTLSLSWDLPTDDATQVNIIWNGGTTGWISATNPPARLVDHLTPGTAYGFTMIARDAALNETPEGTTLIGATLPDPNAPAGGGDSGSGAGGCSADAPAAGFAWMLPLFLAGMSLRRR